MPGPRGGRNFLTEEEKANAPEVTWPLLKRVFSYLKPYIPQLILALLSIGLSAVLDMYPSLLTGRIVDEGLIGRSMPILIKLVVISFFLKIASNLIGVLQNYMNSWIAQHITYDMRNQMFAHLLKMSNRFFTENNQGDIITRMNDDISGVQQIISNTFASILSNLITLIAALIAMYQRNYILATLALIIVPLFSLPTRMAGKKRWSLTREAQECRDEINGILNETLSVSGQLLVKLFTAEDREYERYRQANENMIKLNIKESMAGRWFRMMMSTFTSFGPMLIYLAGGIIMMNYDSSLSVGDITVMVSLLSRMYGPVNSLLSIGVEWIRSMANFTRIFEYFDMEPEIQEVKKPLKPFDSNGTVNFVNVDFGYNPDRQILKNISFSLPKGKCVALVGPSGSGKSTIVNLIPRLYDVWNGVVSFDGIDVRKLDLKWLRSQIGLVSQETYLFSGTIKDNLLYARPDASMEEMIEACKKANIHDFIAAQPEGYDTMVGNRGLKLSGGEKQRISIARVLLKDPSLMIFDEATSALDTISEDLIQQAIEPLIAERTSILIAHRLSTVLHADEILVIKDGEIVEKGKHSELVKAGGVYTELYEKQFKRLEVEEGKS
ncbi:MAG: ABC transporter ATP-binding protein [Erysipelotrichaceae bacterium]|nr:ABC transporter ATP-binding protein [Erysipelotrichaceae bacterium]MCR5096938.1 ABC transporter ATP-binding protein/permease [Erysipelotrichaceae bacterium]